MVASFGNMLIISTKEAVIYAINLTRKPLIRQSGTTTTSYMLTRSLSRVEVDMNAGLKISDIH